MQQATAYPFDRAVLRDAVFHVRAHLCRGDGFGTERYPDAADDHMRLHNGAVHGPGEWFARACHWIPLRAADGASLSTLWRRRMIAKIVVTNPGANPW
jgi:hypothetical protein